MATRQKPDPKEVEATLAKATGYVYKYHPKGAARDLFHLHDDEILMVGPAGTGKSLANLNKIHLVLSKYPNAKAFMARKTRASMTNSCLDMFQRHVLKPPDRVHFHKQDQQFNYPNGSMLAVVGLDDPARILSTDWDIGYIQEATECTTNDWEICTTRLRSWIVPYQQLLGDCNPDKPTHWLKKRCDNGLTKMLLSFHKDNPRLWYEKAQQWTPEGLKYLAKLDRLTGARRARLMLGQWVAAEGLVYEKWDANIHMCSWSDLPKGHEDWYHYWVIDWGYTHPMCWQDWIEDPDTGILYRVREIYHTELLVEDLAHQVMELTGHSYVPQAIVCDHDRGDRATFEKYTKYFTIPAYKEIQPGVKAVIRRTDPLWCHKGPGIRFLRDALVSVDPKLKEAGLPTCTEEETDGYVWDRRHNEDDANSKKDELPVDKNNHGEDCKRYIVAFMDNLADDPTDIDTVIDFGEEVKISPY